MRRSGQQLRSVRNVWRTRGFRGYNTANRNGPDRDTASSDFGGRGASRGRGRHPPGLRGREIGLWYARNGEGKPRLSMELQATVDQYKVTEIRSLLKKFDENDVKLDEAGSSVCSSRRSDIPRSRMWDEEELENEFWRQNGQENDYAFRPTARDAKIDETLLKSFEQKLTSKKYQEMQILREKLPSFENAEVIVRAIRKNQVTVISGETGCGKTTQVPQYILDSYIRKRKGSVCNIICTQPRRISAISVAERVAEERNEICGQNSVGYHIRLENKSPVSGGSLVYCTTGIVLKYLQNDPNLLRASHVILDEIHERDLHTDFLMIILKELLSRRPDLKLVLMSATLNAEQFSKYFGNCPILTIPGFTYPVKEYYLEDVLEMTKYNPPFKHQDFRSKSRNKRRNVDEKQEEYESSKEVFLRTLDGSYHRNTILSLRNMDEEEMDFNLMTELIKYIDHTQPEGAILVFLPGWDQISKLNGNIINDPFYKSSRHHIIPLHSMMPTINQRSVFERPPKGVRKIVLATNIAETSITIDDVVYVVDGGRIKITNFDSNKVISTLNPEWVSLANARQRRGRAGRVQPGICFHLYTKLRENFLESYQLPEILRTRLEELCLQIKILKLGKIIPFVSKAMDPPSLQALDVAIKLLMKLDALDLDENLTPLGYMLAQLPLDPQTGKMILLGAIFGCIDPILTVAATLNFKDPFLLPLGKEEEADFQKKRLTNGCKSDHLLMIKVFKDWQAAKAQGREHPFCREHFLSVSTLRMLEKMKDQLAEQLHNLKFIDSSNVKDRLANVNSDSSNLIKAIVFAGIYPNIAKLKLKPNPSQRRKRPPPLRTASDGSVCFHPKSVNSTETIFESCWLTYHTKVKSSKVFLHDVSMISALSLIFFSGKITIDKPNTVLVDESYSLVCDSNLAELLMTLKRHLNRVLEMKYARPEVTHWDSQSVKASVLSLVGNLLRNEETRLVPVDNKDQSTQGEDDEDEDENQ